MFSCMASGATSEMALSHKLSSMRPVSTPMPSMSLKPQSFNDRLCK